MVNYGSNHKSERLGFINKENLLLKYSQQEIFSLVFGFLPQEFQYSTSPFRKDKNPGAWFEWYEDKLWFFDLGNTEIIRGVRMRNIDCFNAVMIFFNLDNFYTTLSFIEDNLSVVDKLDIPEKPLLPKKEVNVFTMPRVFQIRDANYWKPYGISKENLIEDKVYPISKYTLTNTKKGTIKGNADDIAYVLTDFEDNKKKIYFPKRKGLRFLGNVTKNHLGCLKNLPEFGNKLIISKSYKDCRVFKNYSFYSFWTQSETSLPDIDILFKRIKNYKEVVVCFDNDEQGIVKSKELNTLINNTFPNKSREIKTNGSKDPSDLRKKEGDFGFRKFLQENHL